MNRILAILLIFSVMSCSNELVLTGDYKDIPIVYGLLSPLDTAQYIRIERAFIDEEESPIQIALNPDSLYYPNATATLTRVSSGEVFPLERVDGNLEGYQREDGAFASSPNYLYKIKTSDIQLLPTEEYQLNIERGDELPTVTATTTIIDPPIITTPSSVALGLNFVTGQPTRFRWTTNETTFIYDLKLLFRYREKDNSDPNGTFESKEIVWDIRTGINNSESSEAVQLEIAGEEFFSFLSGSLEVNENLDRRITNSDVLLYVGGEEVFRFQNVASANLGITSSQDIPTYTNLSEGRGVFSAKTIQSRMGIDFTSATKDSVILSASTKALNFN